MDAYDTNGNTVKYEYYTDNLLAAKEVNGEKTHYNWNFQNLTYVYNEDDGYDTEDTYFYDITGISKARIDGQIYCYIKNMHGDTYSTVDSNGTVISSYDYDAFGNQISSNSNDVNPFRYCGEYQDLSSGLIYLRNRYYDPSIGRFISEDPAKDGLNWYVYCENNPINRIDPSGLYDRDAAVQYAVKWHDGTNTPAYERFDTVGAFLSSLGRMRGDCANFVSQCLVAGGLTMNTSWHYYSKMVEEWHGNNSIQKKNVT